MNDKLLTVPEVAEMTRLPEATIRWFRHVGKGPRSAKLGRRVVYFGRTAETHVEHFPH